MTMFCHCVPLCGACSFVPIWADHLEQASYLPLGADDNSSSVMNCPFEESMGLQSLSIIITPSIVCRPFVPKICVPCTSTTEPTCENFQSVHATGHLIPKMGRPSELRTICDQWVIQTKNTLLFPCNNTAPIRNAQIIPYHHVPILT